MKFSEREEILEQRQIRNQMYTRYRGRFLTSTAAIVVLFIVFLFSHGNVPEKPKPTQYDMEIAETLTTLEGRETYIAKTYPAAKIIAEKNTGSDIISVFEFDDQHSFCVFGSTETGYWQEYMGQPYAKTALIKGTAYLKDDTFQYDIYLLGSEKYTSLLITRENMTKPRIVQQERIYFDDAGIAIMQLKPSIIDSYPEIVAYDADGNYITLANGKLPLNKV